MWVAVGVIGAAVIGGVASSMAAGTQAGAATQAANTTAGATNHATDIQYQEFQAQQALMQPFVQSGTTNLNALNAAVAPGGQIDPSKRFTTADWQNSPEYAAYNNAQAAAGTDSTNALKASAAASGNYGGGSMANQLQTNLANLYAQYQPASLQASQANWNAANTQQFNQMSALANPNAAQQTANYAGQYGTQAGNNAITAGNAIAQGQMQSGQIQGQNINNIGNQVMGGIGAYNQNSLYQYGQNLKNGGQLYADAGGNINNVDFGANANNMNTLEFD